MKEIFLNINGGNVVKLKNDSITFHTKQATDDFVKALKRHNDIFDINVNKIPFLGYKIKYKYPKQSWWK